MTPSKKEPNPAVEPHSSNTAEIADHLSHEWIAGFRERIASRGALPVKYDEGSFDNLEGEVEIYGNLPDYLRSILNKNQTNYESFSEPELCQNAIGPLNQSDLSDIFQGKVGLIKNPINNNISQLFFSGHARTSSGRVCYFGSLTCTEVYACLDAPTRLYLGGVNSESDDAIIALAQPMPEYFSFDDFSFSLNQCDPPRSTYRNIEINLSQQLANAVRSDQSIASDILNIALTRTANLCPIKEKRPLVPTTHPLSNIEVASVKVV